MKNQLKKILLVEDEEDIRTVAQIALEDVGGFDVKLCASGAEALQEVKHFKPDLFLLDVMMPDMDGFATLQELRKLPNMKDTPVVFMTARIQESEVVQYKKLGILDVIPKPFEPMTLAETLRELWSKRYDKS